MRSEDFVCKLIRRVRDWFFQLGRSSSFFFFFASEVFFSILAPFIYRSDVKKGVGGFVSRKRLFKAVAGSEQ